MYEHEGSGCGGCVMIVICTIVGTAMGGPVGAVIGFIVGCVLSTGCR
jgi:hypothetical protein